MSGRRILGLRVLQGEERRRVRDQVAFGRAEFELEYAGQPVEPFGREQVFRAASRYLDDRNIYVSDAFVRECQRRVAYCARVLAEHDEEGS